MTSRIRKVKDSLIPVNTGVIAVSRDPVFRKNEKEVFRIWVGKPSNVVDIEFEDQHSAVMECVDIYKIIAKPFLSVLSKPSSHTHTQGQILEVLAACDEDVFAENTGVVDSE